MGSFNLNCIVTGLPLINDEAIIIPMFIKDSSRRNIYVYDNVRIFPFFAVGKYADYGTFEINDDEMSNKTLEFVKKVLMTSSKSKNDDDDNEVDFSEFNWEQFFELCHEDYSSGWGRLAFAAIEKKTFDTIISEYQIHSILDDSVEGYDPNNYGYLGFENYLNSTKKEYENKKLELFSLFDVEDKNQPISWFNLKPYIDFPIRFVETGFISLMRRNDNTDRF